jgi:hypothetical protein
MPNSIYYRLTLAFYLERKGGTGTMKDLICDIVKAMVDQPDQVSVNQVEGDHTTVF